jgi:hypothetical protein
LRPATLIADAFERQIPADMDEIGLIALLMPGPERVTGDGMYIWNKARTKSPAPDAGD